MGRARGVTQLYFAVVIRGSARRLSGNMDYSLAGEERAPRLDNRDDSSLAMDRLFDQARGQNMVVRCFYFEFAGRKSD